MLLSEIHGAPLSMEPEARAARAREQGYDLALYHGTEAEFDRFHPNSHFGSEAQAKMRSHKRIMPVLVRGRRFKRLRDTGRNQWDQELFAKLARQGFDGIVYLNRYEGIPHEQFTALKGRDEARLGDAAFKKLIPAAEDSYVIFDPTIIRSTDAAFYPAFHPGRRGDLLD